MGVVYEGHYSIIWTIWQLSSFVLPRSLVGHETKLMKMNMVRSYKGGDYFVLSYIATDSKVPA